MNWKIKKQSALCYYQRYRREIHRVVLIIVLLIVLLLIDVYGNFLSSLTPNVSSEVMASFIGTLGAGALAYIVARWQIKKASEIQREDNRKEFLFNNSRKYVEQFYKHYIIIVTELSKPIQIQNQKLAFLKEFKDKGTRGGEVISFPEFIEEMQSYRMNDIDLHAIKMAGIELTSLIECNRQIVSKKIISDYLAYTNDHTIYKNLGDSWHNLIAFIIRNNNLQRTDDLIHQHEKAISELNKKIAYSDWRLMSVFRPLQKELFDQLLSGDKIDIAHQLLVQASEWFEIGRYDKCLELCKTSLERKSSSTANRLIGRVYQVKEDYKNAIKYFKKSLSINPESPLTLDLIAGAYISAGEYNMAFETYKQRLSLDFEGYIALPNMVEMLIMDNKPDEAKDYLALSEKISPDNFFANRFLHILLIIVIDNSQDLQSELQQLKDTNDWEFSSWSYDQVGTWIRNGKKTKHLSESQKTHIKELIAALEAEKRKS